jgi:predicted MFS family arabinose efflux permease
MKSSQNTNIQIEINSADNSLSESVIWILMSIISLIHGLICISPGILSSYITELKKEFNLNDEKYGNLGTVYGLGSLIGSLTFTFVIRIINNKYLICGMIIINCFCNFIFFFTINFSILLFSRFISGFATVFCFIYFPIWVENFAMKKWVNFMQTTVQVANTIGNIIGYFIYFILGSNKWKDGFFIESFSVLFLVLIMVMIPDRYYNKKKKLKNEVEISDSNTMKIEKNTGLVNNSEENIKKEIIFNFPFIMIVLYRANRIFIFQALNFWFSDYLQNSLSEKNPKVIFWSYSITMVFSSLIGNILGGIVINKIGGTKSKFSFLAMAILQLLSVLFGIFSPLTNSVSFFTILMSMYILFNSASGIISISATFVVVSEILAGPANGVYSFVVNLIGFLPAPYFYAVMKKILKKESHIIILLMFYGFIGCFELIGADIYMRAKKIRLYSQKLFIFKEEK